MLKCLSQIGSPKGRDWNSDCTLLADSLPHCLDLAFSLAPKWVHNGAFRLYGSRTTQEHLQKINSCQTGQRPAIFLSKFIAHDFLSHRAGDEAATYSLSQVKQQWHLRQLEQQREGVRFMECSLCTSTTLNTFCALSHCASVQRFNFLFSHFIISHHIRLPSQPFKWHSVGTLIVDNIFQDYFVHVFCVLCYNSLQTKYITHLASSWITERQWICFSPWIVGFPG